MIPIERTREFAGLYHVLGGAISPIDGVDPEDLKIDELVARVESGGVEEVVLATNQTTTGEATAHHIAGLLARPGQADPAGQRPARRRRSRARRRSDPRPRLQRPPHRRLTNVAQPKLNGVRPSLDFVEEGLRRIVLARLDGGRAEARKEALGVKPALTRWEQRFSTATPRPLVSSLNEVSLHRISSDVDSNGAELPVGRDWNGAEAPLKDVTGGFVMPVAPLCETTVEALHSGAHLALGCFDQEVNVVRHQAVAEAPPMTASDLIPQQIDIPAVIHCSPEESTSVVAAGEYVEPVVVRGVSGLTGHASKQPASATFAPFLRGSDPI